jgi:hypothetical protein
MIDDLYINYAADKYSGLLLLADYSRFGVSGILKFTLVYPV